MLAELSWLPAAPIDFKESCKSLGAESNGLAARLRFLATHAMTLNQTHTLTAALKRAQAAGKDLSPLAPLRIGLLSDATTSLLTPVLVATADSLATAPGVMADTTVRGATTMRNGSRAPETASALPLIALLGGVTLSVGLLLLAGPKLARRRA